MTADNDVLVVRAEDSSGQPPVVMELDEHPHAPVGRAVGGTPHA